MKTLLYISLAILSMHCTRQTKDVAVAHDQKVGGNCDGCEIMYVGMPKSVNSIDTSAGWKQPNGRRLRIDGIVYKPDGKTPAPDIVLYYWQTDGNGIYAPADGMDERAKRHGHIRGWMKTDRSGKYSLYTIRPAAYPGTKNPEHIHVLVKEPSLSEYYIDELVFDDDRFLTADIRRRYENRGGSGILKTVKANGMETASHNIILGKNIPNYPQRR